MAFLANWSGEMIERATEPDPALEARIVASTPMADETQACQLLGLSAQELARLQLLRIPVADDFAYPLFQFDALSGNVYPAISRIINLAPNDWSELRILHWLTRPHVEFGGAPSDSLASTDIVISAFVREIVTPTQG